jgi:hypothetical protein
VRGVGEPRVYFIQMGQHGPIKVGWTSRTPAARMADFQVGNPERLRLLGSCPDVWERTRETELKHLFASVRVRGEWFCPIPDVLEVIAECCAEDDDWLEMHLLARVLRGEAHSAVEEVVAWSLDCIEHTGEATDRFSLADAVSNHEYWRMVKGMPRWAGSLGALRREVTAQVVARGLRENTTRRVLEGGRLH